MVSMVRMVQFKAYYILWAFHTRVVSPILSINTGSISHTTDLEEPQHANTKKCVMVTSSKALPTPYPFPCFVKTTRSGSTLGHYPIDDRQHLPEAINQALKLGPEVLIEQWIQGREFTVGILKDKPLPVICIESTTGYYDDTAKYQSQDTQY